VLPEVRSKEEDRQAGALLHLKLGLGRSHGDEEAEEQLGRVTPTEKRNRLGSGGGE
jgi:hypothetical protein